MATATATCTAACKRSFEVVTFDDLDAQFCIVCSGNPKTLVCQECCEKLNPQVCGDCGEYGHLCERDGCDDDGGEGCMGFGDMFHMMPILKLLRQQDSESSHTAEKRPAQGRKRSRDEEIPQRFLNANGKLSLVEKIEAWENLNSEEQANYLESESE